MNWIPYVKWLGGPRENLPGGSLKYLFGYFKVRIFKCSYCIFNSLLCFISHRQWPSGNLLVFKGYFFFMLESRVGWNVWMWICPPPKGNKYLMVDLTTREGI